MLGSCICLGVWSCYYRLFLRNPRDNIGPKIDKKATSGSSVDVGANPIYIAESMEIFNFCEMEVCEEYFK